MCSWEIEEEKSNVIFPIICTAFIIVGLCLLMQSMFAKTTYPGCTIIKQYENILIIELDEKKFNGSDESCLRAAKLILEICEDGYKVLIWERVIDIKEAKELVEIGGGPAR